MAGDKEHAEESVGIVYEKLHEAYEMKKSPEKTTEVSVQSTPILKTAPSTSKPTKETRKSKDPQEPPSSTKSKESAKKKNILTTKPVVVQIKYEKDDDCVILEQDTKDNRTSTPIHKPAPSTSKPTKETRKSKDPQAATSAELPSPIVPPPPSEPDAEERCRRKRVYQKPSSCELPSLSECASPSAEPTPVESRKRKRTEDKNTTKSDSSCKSENGNVSKTPKLDYCHTNSSSSSSKADIETSTLPLSVAIFARARQFPREIMVIWCNSLEDDLLGAVCHNPSHSMICVQNLNAIQIPDSQRDMLKNCNIINFNIADSNDLFTPWTIVSFMNTIPIGLKNKIFRNFADVEKEFTNFASMNTMGVSNVIRYTRVGFFPDLSGQLSTKILAFNCPSEQFAKK